MASRKNGFIMLLAFLGFVFLLVIFKVDTTIDVSGEDKSIITENVRNRLPVADFE